MTPQLTSGALTRLMTSELTPDAIGDFQPILQLLSVKKVNSGGGSDRYRLVYSDGEYHCQSMLATKLNDYFVSQNFTPKCIFRLTRCAMNLVQNKRLIITLGIEKVQEYSEKIGNPVNFDKAENQAGAGPSAMEVDPAPTTPAPPKPAPSGSTSSAATNSLPSGFAPLHPIEALSPYSNKWTIRARVTQKSDIRTWSNQRGDGKLFSVNLMDETGEIRATGFNEVVDNLYSKLEEGKVYWFSKARVQLAKKQFSNLSNEYEITLERQSEAIPCEDESAVPKVQFNFTELSQLESVEKDAMVDVLGVVTEVKPIDTINVKSTGKTVSKRDITIVDKSGSSVRMTLWGKQAETFQAENNPVIAFKGVKVGDFGGRTLSLVSSSTMSFHPDFPEAHALQGWYSSEGHSQTFKSQSAGGMGGGGGGGTINRREMKTLQAVKDENLGMNDDGRADYFTTRATIIHIKSDNIMYPACGSDNCSKKVTEVHDGWRCEKCEKTFPKPNYRYILSLSVADYTQTAWLQMFNDPGELILGMTASELHEIKEENETSYTAVIEKATSQTWIFQCKAQQSTYQDQSRVRYGVNRAHKIDYAQESRMLLETIKTFEGVEAEDRDHDPAQRHAAFVTSHSKDCLRPRRELVKQRIKGTLLNTTRLTFMQSFAQISTRPTLVSQLSPSRLPGHSLSPPTPRTAGMASRSGTQASPPPKKMAYFPKIEAQAADSPDFRRVLWTGEHSQLVIMTIPVDGEIGEEVHTVDQHLIFTGGSAKAIVAGEEKAVKEGDLVVVPAGTKHNFINTAKTPLVLYTVYAPAEHATMSVHKSSKEGEKLEGAGKDEPPAWSQGGGK